MKSKQPTQLLTAREVADRLGSTTGTLAYWRSRLEGPPFVKVGSKAVRYSESELEKWIEARAVATR